MELRDAKFEDLPEILDIYNEVIANSNSIYLEDGVNLENRDKWFRSKVASKFPVLVAHENNQVLGYGAYGEFRPAVGYRFTVEHTIHVKSDERGRGIGTLILTALIEKARAQGLHAMIGAIDSKNVESFKLHEKHGFVQVARLPEIAYKNGVWLNLILMQKTLP